MNIRITAFFAALCTCLVGVPALASHPPGAPLGSEFRITPGSYSSAWQERVHVRAAQYPNGDVLVTWISNTDGVMLARLSATGSMIGSPVQIDPRGPLVQNGVASVAIGPTGLGAVVWGVATP